MFVGVEMQRAFAKNRKCWCFPHCPQCCWLTATLRVLSRERIQEKRGGTWDHVMEHLLSVVLTKKGEREWQATANTSITVELILGMLR
jgi:hypothetical protein